MQRTVDGPSAPAISGRRLALAFVAGFLGVLVFHQPALALLHAAGLVPVTAYDLRPVPPFGVPAFLSAAFWGGVWGVVFALVEPRFPRGGGYWVAAAVFGAVALTAVFWLVVAPIKGMPFGGGWRPMAWLIGFVVNGAWGVGTALFLRLFARRA
jgi:hypothetical protein